MQWGLSDTMIVKLPAQAWPHSKFSINSGPRAQQAVRFFRCARRSVRSGIPLREPEPALWARLRLPGRSRFSLLLQDGGGRRRWGGIRASRVKVAASGAPTRPAWAPSPRRQRPRPAATRRLGPRHRRGGASGPVRPSPEAEPGTGVAAAVRPREGAGAGRRRKAGGSCSNGEGGKAAGPGGGVRPPRGPAGRGRPSPCRGRLRPRWRQEAAGDAGTGSGPRCGSGPGVRGPRAVKAKGPRSRGGGRAGPSAGRRGCEELSSFPLHRALLN